jgi:hypothetical protein
MPYLLSSISIHDDLLCVDFSRDGTLRGQQAWLNERVRQRANDSARCYAQPAKGKCEIDDDPGFAEGISSQKYSSVDRSGTLLWVRDVVVQVTDFWIQSS